MKARRGLLISFEGTEGSGKSTQMKVLAERLRAEGHIVTENQEPGATDIGRQIRRIFLAPENNQMAPMTELLLVFASRAQAAMEIIEPALARGEIVLSDRFTDSTLAYQGEARSVGFDIVMKAHELALGDLLPDLTICVMVDLEAGLARANRRNQRIDEKETRLDRQSIEFHRRVLAAYKRIAEAQPERFHLVDGSGSIEAVSERVWKCAEPVVAAAGGA